MEKLLTFMNYWLGKLYIQNKYVPLDKFMHGLSGAILATAILLVTGSASVSFVSVSLVACLKEVYDLLHKDKHTPDIWDWVATSLGGLLASLLFSVV